MTEGQVRYQSLMENQRHNLEMERLGAIESNIASRQAAVREAELRAKQDELHLKAQRHKAEMLNLFYQNEIAKDNMWASHVSTPTKAILGTFVFGFQAGGQIGSSLASPGFSQASLFN